MVILLAQYYDHYTLSAILLTSHTSGLLDDEVSAPEGDKRQYFGGKQLFLCFFGFQQFGENRHCFHSDKSHFVRVIAREFDQSLSSRNYVDIIC